MSWCERNGRRRVLRGGLALFGVAGLSGCFRPMLAEGTAASELRGDIALPRVNDRFSYTMNEVLEKRLGVPGDPTYRLEVDTRMRERGLLVAQDNAVTRLQIVADATMRLYRTGEAQPVLTETLRSEAGFDQTASLFASRTTRRDIEERIARDLGERIARQVQARATRL